MTPSVSIILPTYNREQFLPEAFEAICRQTYTDWELVVVDDGSTDNTAQLIEKWQNATLQPILYAPQENAGAYAARNHGLDLVSGQYIAFYDSDDLWTEHHLSHCVQALEENQDVDWVMGYATRIDATTAKILDPNTFLTAHGAPSAMLTLRSEERNSTHVLIDERTLERALNPGFSFELHTALIRRQVFDKYRFKANYRNGQDRFAMFTAILAGHRLAYINEQHLIYRVHENNDSLVRTTNSTERRERITKSLINQYLEFADENELTRRQRRAIHAKTANSFFWGLGYLVYLRNHDYRNALRYFAKAIWYQPSNLSFYKTTLLTFFRWCMSRAQSP